MLPANDDATQAALRALVGRVHIAVERIAGKGGLIIQAEGMKRTHVRTGSLRRSWRMEGPEGGDGIYSSRVGPTMIYARRQELGFQNMTDSLGRLFTHDPGWPYVRPTRETVGLQIKDMAVAELRNVIGG